MPDSEDDWHLPEWRSPMDLDATRRRQMRAVKAAERIMYDSYERGDVETALKACTRLTQAVRCYIRVLEAQEFEDRISRLEERAFGPGGDGTAEGHPEISE